MTRPRRGPGGLADRRPPMRLVPRFDDGPGPPDPLRPARGLVIGLIASALLWAGICVLAWAVS